MTDQRRKILKTLPCPCCGPSCDTLVSIFQKEDGSLGLFATTNHKTDSDLDRHGVHHEFFNHPDPLPKWSGRKKEPFSAAYKSS